MAGAVIAAFLAAENAALHWLVLPRLNAHPNQFQVQADAAWTIMPGWLHVRGLLLRGQGPRDRWQMTADTVVARVSLRDLWSQRFVASQLRAEGVTARYHTLSATGDPPNPMAPEIPGFDTLPPVDENRERKPRWDVELQGMQLGLTQVWLEDLRFLGPARATADVSLSQSVTASVRLTPDGGSLWLGDAPVASDMLGDLLVQVTAMPRQVSLGRDTLRSISGTVSLQGQFEELRFVEYYLGSAPWLGLKGVGELNCDLRLQAGRFGVGSWMTASSADLLLEVGDYAVRGASQISMEVDDWSESPTQVVVGFRDFVIVDPTDAVMVQGNGFLFSAATHDVSLVDAFTSVEVVFDMPASAIPDVVVFNRLLPAELGAALTSGTGQISAHVEGGTAEGSLATGQVAVLGRSLGAKIDRLGLTLDLDVALPLSSGSLASGRYDISGASVALSNVRLTDLDDDEAPSPAPPWWTEVTVVKGTLEVDDPLSFDATMTLSAANSGPFLRVLSELRPIAPWIQKILDRQDVQGSGRISVSPSGFELSDFVVLADPAELRMHWRRQDHQDVGQVFARYSLLSVGVGVRAGAQRLHLLGARKWYEGASLTRDEPDEASTPREE